MEILYVLAPALVAPALVAPMPLRSNAGRQSENQPDWMAPVIGAAPLLDRERELTLMKQLATTTKRLATSANPHACTDDTTSANQHGCTDDASSADLAERQLALSTLVSANLRLVASIARSYKNRGLAWHDLMQEGTLGLLMAADKFEPERGLKFSTYATYWVRHRCQRAVQNDAAHIRLPVYMQHRITEISRARAARYYATGQTPGLEELTDELQLSASKIDRALEAQRYSSLLSLDAPLRSSRPGSHPTSLGGMIADTRCAPVAHARHPRCSMPGAPLPTPDAPPRSPWPPWPPRTSHAHSGDGCHAVQFSRYRA